MITCTTTQTDAAEYAADIIVVFVNKNGRLGTTGKLLDQASGSQLSTQIDLQPGLDKAGGFATLTAIDGIQTPRILVVSSGAGGALEAKAWRRVLGKTCRTLIQAKAAKALLCLGDLKCEGQSLQWMAQEAIMASNDAAYQFESLKSKPEPAPVLQKLAFHAANASDQRLLKAGCKQGRSIAKGITLTKDLGNLPGNICTPTYLADKAKDMGEEFEQLKVKVLSEKDMDKLGMSALLSVSRGSRQPAKMIVFDYSGGPKGAAPSCWSARA